MRLVFTFFVQGIENILAAFTRLTSSTDDRTRLFADDLSRRATDILRSNAPRAKNSTLHGADFIRYFVTPAAKGAYIGQIDFGDLRKTRGVVLSLQDIPPHLIRGHNGPLHWTENGTDRFAMFVQHPGHRKNDAWLKRSEDQIEQVAADLRRKYFL